MAARVVSGGIAFAKNILPLSTQTRLNHRLDVGRSVWLPSSNSESITTTVAHANRGDCWDRAMPERAASTCTAFGVQISSAKGATVDTFDSCRPHTIGARQLYRCSCGTDLDFSSMGRAPANIDLGDGRGSRRSSGAISRRRACDLRRSMQLLHGRLGRPTGRALLTLTLAGPSNNTSAAICRTFRQHGLRQPPAWPQIRTSALDWRGPCECCRHPDAERQVDRGPTLHIPARRQRRLIANGGPRTQST